MKLFAIFMMVVGTTMIITAIYLATQLDLNLPIRREYSIELINQDTVKVFSHSTQKLYTVPFDKIDSALLIDNL